MAFFSFSLAKESFNVSLKKLKPNQTYYSKDLTLWKELNNKKKKIPLNFIKRENRERVNKLGDKLLLCLPPKFGLGDAIEYSIAIKSIEKSNNFSKIGIAFCNNQTYIFQHLFLFENIYPICISSEEICKYDTVFHITLELDSLKFQKYKRSDTAKVICNHFKVPLKSFKRENEKQNTLGKKKISIFPVSTSPVRILPHEVIGMIKKNFEKDYVIEIYIDDSNYSQKLEKFYFDSNIEIKKPINVQKVIEEISNINFGIFVDSGPLHIAKIFNKKGVFVETSVSHKILLDDVSNILTVKNKYKSNYCKGPCGLVDIFSLNNNVGCYETNQIFFNELKKIKNIKGLQRRNKKENNAHFVSNPVGCVKKIDIDNLLKSISLKLREC